MKCGGEESIPRDHRIVHDRLIRLLLEIAVPTRTELLHVILAQLLLGRPNLDTSVNAISSKWTSTIDIPLVEHPFLNLRITTYEVIKALGVRLGTISGKRQIVVLKIETDAWKVNLALHASFLQFGRVADAGALEHEWGTESAARDDDLFASTDDGLLLLAWV